MRHLRTDYEAIQPWPTKRPHWARTNIDTVEGRNVPVPEDYPEELCSPIIPDDEPVFLLRAKDQIAPFAVRKWAAALVSETAVTPNGDLDAARALARRVNEWADEMEAYAAEHYDGGKVPDTPSEFLT